MRQDLKMIDST